MHYLQDSFCPRLYQLNSGCSTEKLYPDLSLVCKVTLISHPDSKKILIDCIHIETSVDEVMDLSANGRNILILDCKGVEVLVHTKLQDLNAFQFPLVVITPPQIHLLLLDEVYLTRHVTPKRYKVTDDSNVQNCQLCLCCRAAETIFDSYYSAYNPTFLCSSCVKLFGCDRSSKTEIDASLINK